MHGDEAYAKLATGRLARAIQINTVSEDSMASGPLDERFAGVAEFGKFLDDEFPLVCVAPSLAGSVRGDERPLTRLLTSRLEQQREA